MMEKNDLLGALRWKALELFKSELLFLEEIENSSKEKNIYKLSHGTEFQLRCILYILFFISKKEIPIRRQSLTLLTKSNIESLKKLSQNQSYFISLIETSSEEKVLFLLPFCHAMSSLVYPVLNKN